MKEFEGYRVLLADDEEIAREIVANVIEDLGVECISVGSGDELLATLFSPVGDTIDLVLTDINMPGKSGIDACSQFRASEHPRAKSLPFIGISADTNPAIFDNAISAGMNGMTMKPVTRSTLQAHFHLTLKDNKANKVFCERIQEALAKSLFFSTVSHDIRTPLNAIIGFSEMLKEGFESKSEHDLAVDSILMSGRTLLQLINDVLDLSKLESGRMNIEPEPTDVAALLREIVSAFHVTHRKPGLEIRFKAGDMPHLMLDPQRMRQIAFNLVGNAVKFTKQGYVELSASFARGDNPGEGRFVLSVEDTGCGISEEDVKKLATPFVQVGSKDGKKGGTGLGLSICRRLAKAMGGDMVISSVLGKGTTFSIDLPSVKVAESPKGDKSEGKGEGTAQPARQKNWRILVADDTRTNQIVLKTMFKKLGILDVTVASNGREALDILTAPGVAAFDFVLTDMWMPEMTGVELAAAIRANKDLSGMPIYLFTAEVEMKDVYREKGFDGILLKPATLESLKGLCI